VTEDQEDLLQQATDSIAAARLLLDGGYPGFAASRAYYAMFYAAEALLETEGLAFSKHAAVIAAFGKNFAQAGKVPIEHHRFLIEAYSIRQTGDYGERLAVTAEQAAEQIQRAVAVMDAVRRLLVRGAQDQGTGGRK
jgi:uncharacterized protein (UPF0332 family)